jgi:diguanylate cyclase (GGDEF)-like protein
VRAERHITLPVAGDDVGRIAADIAVVGASRQRLRDGVLADRSSALLTGGTFLAVVAGWWAWSPPSSFPAVAFVACVAMYAVAASVEFEVGPGCAVPTTPVQVVMLFVLPPALVPVAVLAGLFVAMAARRLVDHEHRERPLVVAATGWQSVGPAMVFAIAHAHTPQVSDWPVYVAALGAQFVLDAAVTWTRNGYGLQVPFVHLRDALAFTFASDALLAPVGLAAAAAAPGSAAALWFLAPVTALLAMLQSDRRRQIDRNVALGIAFDDTRALARRDTLTGLGNRLAWEETVGACASCDDAVGVVLADVDGLKAANDEYGHSMGDRLLVAIADVLCDAVATVTDVAPPDAVFRLGGDEFAVLLPSHGARDAAAVAAAIRHALGAHGALDGVVAVSASVGAGHAVGGGRLLEAIDTADRQVNAEKDRRGARRR